METLLLRHPEANSTSVIVRVCVSLPMPTALAALACRAALGCHTSLSAQRAEEEKSLMSEYIPRHPDRSQAIGCNLTNDI